MTRTQLNNDTDVLLDDGKPAGSILPSQDAALRKKGYDYSEQVVADNVQNNLLPSATMSPSVNAVLAGLDSVTDDVQAQIDEGIAGVYRDAGNYDASVGTFPTQTAQGNPIEAGNLFTVSVAGTLGGVNYAVGEAFRALVDTPGQTAGNWQKSIFIAGTQTTTTAGLVRKATDAEVVAGTANDNSVSTKQLQDKLNNLPSTSATLQQVVTAGNNYVFNNFKTTISGQVKTENTSTQASLLIQPTNAQFAKNSSGIKTTTLQMADTPTANRLIKLPDDDGTLAIQKYKSYVALISQEDTNAPIVTVIQNEIGNIVWSRLQVGSYAGVLSGAFPNNKTFLPKPNQPFNEASVSIGRFSDNQISMSAFYEGQAYDNILNNCYIEIRVYN